MVAAENPLASAEAIRHADRELLSLALIDSRNHLLAWLAAFEAAGGLAAAPGEPALALAARAGWFQEYWIARHVQRNRGEAADPAAARLASIEPRSDRWRQGDTDELDPATLRHYLGETLEVTLDLLAGTADDDTALHVYRLALAHEDRLCEALAEGAAELQLPLPAGSFATAPPARVQRDPIWLPALPNFIVGSARGGFVPGPQRWAHEVAVPEFEIDAQAVNWARFVEFADDAGYDRRELWTDAGWAWLEAEGRRAPRDVEQLRGGVAAMRWGKLQRLPAGQAVMHVTRHEAEAWCRWAGRRLPTEPEWEAAARHAASRGFLWGDVVEWVAGSARPWPGWAPAPGMDPMPERGTLGVQRGASWLTLPRCHDPKARRFALPAADRAFGGFRSCAL